jgi:hypothetical protein
VALLSRLPSWLLLELALTLTAGSSRLLLCTRYESKIRRAVTITNMLLPSRPLIVIVIIRRARHGRFLSVRLVGEHGPGRSVSVAVVSAAGSAVVVAAAAVVTTASS